MARELDIIIETDGTVSIDAIGFKGKGCTEVTDEIAKALGKKTSEKRKTEYWQPNPKRQIKQKQKH